MKQYICVTGGAGGIGSAIVRRYAALPDAQVIVLDKVPFVDSALVNVESRAIDVTDLDQVKKIAAELVQKNIFLSHLVCVAGGGSGEFKKLTEVEDTLINDSIRLNLTSQIFLSKYLMTSAFEGDRSIVFVSSVNAVKSFGLTAYSAAKAGLLGLTLELAGSLAPVRVNVVLPGTVPTPRTKKEPKDFDEYLRKTLLGRFATPEDVAAACFFFTHMTNVVTGAQLVVDAGQVISTK